MADNGVRLLAITVCVLWMASLGQGISVMLKHLSTVYLPHAEDANGTLRFDFETDAVEKADFDSANKMIYAVGEHTMHVVDASDPERLSLLHTMFDTGVEFTDVLVCEQAVFASFQNITSPLQGGIQQFEPYDKQNQQLRLFRTIPVASLPDNVQALRSRGSCTGMVVAMENSLVDYNGELEDPPGQVTIVRFPDGLAREPDVTTVDFTAFNGRFQELSQQGVRWVYRHNNQFSDDLEPEYVTLNGDQTKAYVCLQENNAIAVVDLTSDTVTDIHGLGFKNWSNSKLDPSDVDGGIHMMPWAIYGMYQPDGLQWFRWGRVDYLLTANEGDDKDMDNFDETRRGAGFSSSLANSVSSEMRAALSNDSQLGRLTFSQIDGKNADDKFERLYTYGARSFSIWRVSDMALVYDSGSELGAKMAELRPDLFNTDIDDGGDRVDSGKDQRSDDKGMEPESVAVAEMEDHLLIFVGLEKPGSVAVYSLARNPEDDTLEPQFQQLYTGGIPAGDRTWNQLYEERRLHTMDPESLLVIPADSGVADYPILLASGTESGTLSFLKIEISDVTGSAPTQGPVLGIMCACLLLIYALRK